MIQLCLCTRYHFSASFLSLNLKVISWFFRQWPRYTILCYDLVLAYHIYCTIFFDLVLWSLPTCTKPSLQSRTSIRVWCRNLIRCPTNPLVYLLSTQIDQTERINICTFANEIIDRVFFLYWIRRLMTEANNFLRLKYRNVKTIELSNKIRKSRNIEKLERRKLEYWNL